jgi:MFS transporter, DHA1 family, multidrug resistance protein
MGAVLRVWLRIPHPLPLHRARSSTRRLAGPRRASRAARPHDRRVRAPRGGLQLVYAIVFIAFLDNFAMLPTVGPFARTLGADPAGVGVAVAAYSGTNLLFNLVGGYLLDRAGRKRLAVGGLAVAAVAVAVYTAAATPGALIAARLLHGAAGGVLVPALFTLVGDLARSGARGRAMGRAGAFIGAAAVAGPAAAGVLRGAAGFGSVFGAVAAVLALGALLTAVFLRETMPATQLDDAPAGAPAVGRLLTHRDLLVATAAVFAFTAAFGTLAAFLPDQVEARGAGAAVSGALFAVVSGVAALLMLSPAAQWVDRAGPGAPVRTGMALFAVALGLLAGDTLALAVVASVVFGLGFGVLFPAATGAVAIAAPLRGRGRAFGLFNAAYSLGFIVGSPLAGAVAGATAASPYLVPGAACVAVLVLELVTARRRSPSPTA